MKQLTTWGSAFDWYWENVAKRQRQAKSFKINSQKIFDYAGRSLPLSRMGKGLFWIEFMNDLMEANPNMSTSTVNRVTTVGTTVLRKTFAAGLHSVDCPTFARQKEGKARLTWFTKEQVDKMAHVAVDVFDRQDLADAIIFAAYTGLRQSEQLRLRSSDIDLSKSLINVGGQPHFRTKNDDHRAIPIHSKLEPIINNRLSNYYLFGDDWLNKDQLFRAFKKVRGYCGISEDYVWHSLRHSCGTFLGEVTHPRQIMAIMGHRSINTSLRYTHATDKALRNAMDAL